MHLKQAYEMGVQLALEEAGLVKEAGPFRKWLAQQADAALSEGASVSAAARKALIPSAEQAHWSEFLVPELKAQTKGPLLEHVRQMQGIHGGYPEQNLMRMVMPKGGPPRGRLDLNQSVHDIPGQFTPSGYYGSHVLPQGEHAPSVVSGRDFLAHKKEWMKHRLENRPGRQVPLP